MELAFLWLNMVMLIVVTAFGIALIWRIKSNYSIESQITSLSLIVLLVIGSIAQLIFGILLDENVLFAILQIIIWIINLISHSVYFRYSKKRNKKQ